MAEMRDAKKLVQFNEEVCTAEKISTSPSGRTVDSLRLKLEGPTEELDRSVMGLEPAERAAFEG